MKKIKLGLLLSLIAASNVYAMTEGPYLGLLVGQSNLHNVQQTINTTDINGNPTVATFKPSNNGFGGRLFGGYQFNSFLGFEMGFTYYTHTTYKVTSSSGAPVTCGTPSTRTDAVDIIGKGTIPAGPIGLFATAGFAVALVNNSGILQPAPASPNCKTKQSVIKLRPTIGIGASYDLSDSLQTQISFSRILQGSGIRNADLIAIGISYHFVDHYCGQFLC